MEGSNLGMFHGPDAVNSDHQVGFVYEQSRNIPVYNLDRQKNEDFVEKLVSPFSLYQPSGDVDLFSAIPVPLSIMPPGPVPNTGGLTCFGVDCAEASSSHLTFDTDDNVEASRYPLNTGLRMSLIHPVTRCHDQVDKMSWEDNLVSLYSNPVGQRVYQENHGITHYDATVTVAVRGPNEASSSIALDNRRRRAKIKEEIKALEESTPQFGKRTRESVLDNVIDYVKYLKLQVTALSQSRLGGEPIHHPFVHLEGYGHYLVHQQKPSEPLEEVIGHLMDSNLPLASELLESKGLELLPVSWADRIVKASADKFI